MNLKKCTTVSVYLCIDETLLKKRWKAANLLTRWLWNEFKDWLKIISVLISRFLFILTVSQKGKHLSILLQDFLLGLFRVRTFRSIGWHIRILADMMVNQPVLLTYHWCSHKIVFFKCNFYAGWGGWFLDCEMGWTLKITRAFLGCKNSWFTYKPAVFWLCVLGSESGLEFILKLAVLKITDVLFFSSNSLSVWQAKCSWFVFLLKAVTLVSRSESENNFLTKYPLIFFSCSWHCFLASALLCTPCTRSIGAVTT